MRRQLLAGRFGPDDHFDASVGVDEQRTYLQLVAGETSLDHGIGGALTSLKKLGIFPSEIGIDLLVLAAHVHRCGHANLSRRTVARLMDARDSPGCARK